MARVFVYARLFGINALVGEFDEMEAAKRLTRALRAKHPSPAHFSYGSQYDGGKFLPWNLLRAAILMPPPEAKPYLDGLREKEAVRLRPRKARPPSIAAIRKAARFGRAVPGSTIVYHRAATPGQALKKRDQSTR